jgi:hypothetical protein
MTYPRLRKIPVKADALKAGEGIDGEPGSARGGGPRRGGRPTRPIAGHRGDGVAGVGVPEPVAAPAGHLIAGHGLG